MTHEEIVNSLPELSLRVNNLKGKHYKGCGFHYSLVNTLNYLLEEASCELDLERSILFEASYEDLVERVTTAEKTEEPMESFSNPELKKQADDLYSQIFAGLREAGVQASMNENRDGIMIPEYFYIIARVREITRGYGVSTFRSGKLEVDFQPLHLGSRTLCNAKGFKADTKNLVTKVVASIKGRRDVILAFRVREEKVTKAREPHGATLKAMRDNYPEFKANIEPHNSQINLSFKELTEDQARLILMTLSNAGIKGDADVPSED